MKEDVLGIDALKNVMHSKPEITWFTVQIVYIPLLDTQAQPDLRIIAFIGNIFV